MWGNLPPQIVGTVKVAPPICYTDVVRTGFEPALGLTTYDILFTTTPCRHLTMLSIGDLHSSRTSGRITEPVILPIDYTTKII
jgi:hypothetical protein